MAVLGSTTILGPGIVHLFLTRAYRGECLNCNHYFPAGVPTGWLAAEARRGAAATKHQVLSVHPADRKIVNDQCPVRRAGEFGRSALTHFSLQLLPPRH